MLNWWFHTDAGLAARVGVGGAIFLLLALIDLARRGRQATRWREYLLLLAAVVAALGYGVINDQITSRISWEYFYYGKELATSLGPATPPDPRKLHWAAALVGMKATWSAGLIFGAMLLLANNPRRGRIRLRNRELLAWLPRILLSAVVCAVLFGVVGYLGGLTSLNEDFPVFLHDNLWRPRRFMCVYGVHLGGYIGGFGGAVWAAVAVWRAGF